jgi:hypothetical protein
LFIVLGRNAALNRQATTHDSSPRELAKGIGKLFDKIREELSAGFSVNGCKISGGGEILLMRPAKILLVWPKLRLTTCLTAYAYGLLGMNLNAAVPVCIRIFAKQDLAKLRAPPGGWQLGGGAVEGC